MSPKAGLFTELKRRNVFRVAAAYAVVAWLLVQASDIMLSNFGAPDWVFKTIVAVLLIGFPLALFLAWAYELTPDGVKRSGEVALQESVTPQTGRTIDKLILIGMVVVVAVIVADRFVFKDGGPDGSGPAAEQAARLPVDDARAVAIPVAEGPATTSAPAATDEPGQTEASGIAVLPFVNMSPDPDNAYFADGISEELLNILAGIEGLKVASRTSAFSFKGKDTPIPEIARLLDVQHVLEGSVRKQGQRVRITAQLIEAGSDTHLWSQTYERELVDIFRVQEEIAVAITTALEGILGTRRVSVDAPTDDLEAYQDFLRGRSGFYQRFELDRAIDDLQAAVDRDPQFAEAWAFLSAATGVVYGGGYPTDQDPAALKQRFEQASARALELDPDIPIVLGIMGQNLAHQGKMAEGIALLERAARQVDPDTSPRLWLGIALAELGYLDRALPWFESAHAQDPLVPINHGYLGYAYAAFGREEEALRIASRGLEMNPNSPYWIQLLSIEAIHSGDIARFTDLWTMLGVDEEFIDALKAAALDPDRRPALFARIPAETEGQYSFLVLLSLVLHDTERLFDVVRRTHHSGENYLRLAAWLPSLGWLREDPRFYEFMRERGAVAYWEAEGFPRGCHLVNDPAGRRLDCSEYAP